MEPRPDEIGTGTAAALLGISGEMLRRVVKAGHVPVHRRGFTTVPAAVQGYAAFLREEARRAESNAAAVRSHRAKAAATAAANARRRSGLLDRAEAEEIIVGIATVGCDQLSALVVTGVSPATASRVAQEVRLAVADVRAALETALVCIRGGVAYD